MAPPMLFPVAASVRFTGRTGADALRSFMRCNSSLLLPPQIDPDRLAGVDLLLPGQTGAFNDPIAGPSSPRRASPYEGESAQNTATT
jgi:hypothetical protein